MQPSNAGEIDGNAISLTRSEMREKIICEIFDRLYVLSNVIEEQTREIEKLTSLNKNQALTIKEVSRSPSARVSDLARSLHLNPATMVRILDHLEEQGLITRTRSKEDRRVVEIELTDKAADVRSVLCNITHDSMIHCLGTTEDRELFSMHKVLRRLSSLFTSPARTQPESGENR